jgi:hypothetical protein
MKYAIAIMMFFFCTTAHAIDMNIVKQIESSGRADAYNAKSQARGLYQITPICLQEWNNFHRKEQYTKKDLFNPVVNEKIARWYMLVRIPQMLRHYKVADTIENRIIAWNAGISFAIKGVVPAETKAFICKYKGRV